MNIDRNTENTETSFFEDISFKFLPYWPLFVFFIISFIVVAWFYLRNATPIYEATSTMLISDQKKGADENKIQESINLLSSNTLVENETEVIHSRALMQRVVKQLRLYAPFFEDGLLGKYTATSAYTSSPISIEIADPDRLYDTLQVFFTYDAKNKTVNIGNKLYPLNQFVSTPVGNLKFIENPRYSKPAKSPLYFSLIEPKYMADFYLSNLTVAATTKLSSVVNLVLDDEVPARAEDILNTLMKTYTDAGMEYKDSIAKNTIAFVDDRLRVVESDLNNVEKKIQNYKDNQGIVDLSTQGKLYLQTVGENDQKLADVNLQLDVLNQVEKYVTSKNNSTGIVPATLGVNDPVLNKLLDRLYNAEVDYERLRKTTAENNPILQSVANEIEQVRPSILENIRNQKASLQTSLNNISNTSKTYNSQLQAIPQKERELVSVSREQLIKNNVYSFLLQKREETALAYASDINNSRVISRAQTAVTPVSPRKSIVYLASLMLAFVVSVGTVLAKEMFTGKIMFRSEIENYTHTPIVGEISYFSDKKSIFLKGQNNRVIQEQFRQLRAAAGLFSKDHSKKKILVTSSIPGEGKSLISANLALSLARSGKKVVLLDMDIRNPQFSRIFKLRNSVGIAEYLEENIEPAEIVEGTEFHNLSIIPAGATKANPTELLLNGKLPGLFNYLEEEYDYIVVDTSPVSPVTDAYIVSDFCDLTLYVVRHKHTPKMFIKKLDDNNRFKPLKNLFIVFNGIKPRGFIKRDFGYGYGYGFENKHNEKYLIS
jgi:capsular exopolysaccharide synthesis family protein